LPHALFILRSEEFQNDKQEREDYEDGRYDQAGALFKEVLENKSKRLKNDDEEMLGFMAWMVEAEKLFV
jgi:hypothetical protein